MIPAGLGAVRPHRGSVHHAYARTTAKKRADTAKGKQFSTQPKDVAAKTADARLADLPRTELVKRAGRCCSDSAVGSESRLT